jgi:hypothetical protein
MSDQELTQPVSLRAWLFPTLIHGVLGLMILTRLLVAGAGYERVFRDFNMRLPYATEASLHLSAAVQSQTLLCIAVGTFLFLLDGLVLWLLGGWERFEGQVWFFVVLVLLLGTWLLMELSFFIAYLKLQEGLSRTR